MTLSKEAATGTQTALAANSLIPCTCDDYPRGGVKMNSVFRRPDGALSPPAKRLLFSGCRQNGPAPSDAEEEWLDATLRSSQAGGWMGPVNEAQHELKLVHL